MSIGGVRGPSKTVWQCTAGHQFGHGWSIRVPPDTDACCKLERERASLAVEDAPPFTVDIAPYRLCDCPLGILWAFNACSTISFQWHGMPTCLGGQKLEIVQPLRICTAGSSMTPDTRSKVQGIDHTPIVERWQPGQNPNSISTSLQHILSRRMQFPNLTKTPIKAVISQQYQNNQCAQ